MNGPRNKAAAAARKSGPAGTETEGIEVVSKPERFRRAGFEFTREPRTLRLSELTEEQLEQIEEEAMLASKRVTVEAPAAAEDTSKAP